MVEVEVEVRLALTRWVRAGSGLVRTEGPGLTIGATRATHLILTPGRPPACPIRLEGDERTGRGPGRAG